MEDDLIAAHGDEPKLMPYLHLPVQSGSDRMLKAMNRKHTAEQYLRLIDRIRAARPDILLSSDFIVGFPGETDADHQRHAGPDPRGGVRHGLQLQILGPPRHPRRRKAPNCRPRWPMPGCTKCRRWSPSSSAPRRRPWSGARSACFMKRPGGMAGQMVGKSDHLHAVHVDDSHGPVGRVGPGADISLVRQLFGGRQDFALGQLWRDVSVFRPMIYRSVILVPKSQQLVWHARDSIPDFALLRSSSAAFLCQSCVHCMRGLWP